MGLLASRVSGYTDVMMMNTDSHLHFKDTLQKQWTTAQAAGRMETMQAQNAVGSGAVAGTSKGWAMGFYGISTAIYAFSIYGCFIGLILGGVVYLMKASQAAMAASVFAVVFFFVFFLLFHAPIARAGLVSGTNILISLVTAAIVAGIVGFFIYKEEGNNNNKSSPNIITYTDEEGNQQQVPINDLPAYSF